MSSNASYVDEEILETTEPTKKVQTATNSTSRKPAPAPDPPIPKPSSELSLPGKKSSFVPPPPLDSSSNTKISPMTGNTTKTIGTNKVSPIVPMTAPPGVSAIITIEESGDEDEEEWEQVTATSAAVPATAAPVQQPDFDLQLEQDIFGDEFGAEADADAEGEGEGEEIDVNAFEAELNDVVGDDDDDDDMEDAMQDEAGGNGSRQPISLNKLASGMVEGMDSEDDFSSSESESD